MSDSEKSREQLVEELGDLRSRLGRLEQIEAQHEKAQEQLDRFKKMADLATYGCAMADLEGNLVYANESFAAMHGYASEALMGKNLEMFHSDSQLDLVRRIKKRVFETGKGVENEEVWHVHRNGTEFPTLMNIWLIRDSDGSPSLICTTAVDMTERKKAEEALAREKNLLRTLIDSLPDRIFVKDAEGRFVICNKAVADDAEAASPDDLIGKSDFDLYPQEKAQAYFEEEREIMRTGRPVINEEKPGVNGVREAEWALNTKLPWRDGSGNIIGIVGANRDITDRKRAQEALDKERRMLRTLTDNIPDQIYVKDTESKFVLCNRATAKFHGMANPEDIVGKTDFDLYPPDIAQQCKEEERQVLRTGKPMVNCEESDTDKEGNWVCGLTMKVPLVDSEGEIIGIVGVSRNITERKKAEQALIESEERYKEMFHAAAEGIVVADVETKKFRYANPAICEMLGYTEEELTNMGVLDVHPKEELDYVVSEFEAQVRNEKTLVANIPCLRKDGTIIYADINTTNVTIDGRSSNVGFFTDTTERKLAEEALQKAHDELEARVQQRTADLAAAVEELRNEIAERTRAEKALRKAEERFRTIFENTAVGLYRTTPDGRILLANPALLKMLGYGSFEELAKINLEEHGIDVSTPRSAFKRHVERGGRVIGLESVWIRRNGTKLFICESAVTIRDEKGNVLYYEGTVEDITERKKAEDKLLVYQEQLRSLASELSLAEERLRRRIATDVHDNISQNLAISKMKLESLAESVESPDLRHPLEEIRDLIGQTIESTRALTFEMSPPVLYELGFEAAVGWLTRQARQRYDLAVDFKDDGRDKPLDNDIRVLLFQAVRELLVNVVKHASARQAKVSTRRVGNKIRVTVQDDGAGFDASKIGGGDYQSGGFGLFNIRERLDHIGGRVTIESKQGKGTRVTLIVPLDNEGKGRKGEKR